MLAYPFWSAAYAQVQQSASSSTYRRASAAFAQDEQRRRRHAPAWRLAARIRPPAGRPLRARAQAGRPGRPAASSRASTSTGWSAGQQRRPAAWTRRATPPTCATARSTTASRRCREPASRSPSPATAPPTARRSTAWTRCAPAIASTSTRRTRRFRYSVAKTTTVLPDGRRRALRPRLRPRAHHLHAALQRRATASSSGRSWRRQPLQKARAAADACSRDRQPRAAQRLGKRRALHPRALEQHDDVWVADARRRGAGQGTKTRPSASAIERRMPEPCGPVVVKRQRAVLVAQEQAAAHLDAVRRAAARAPPRRP